MDIFEEIDQVASQCDNLTTGNLSHAKEYLKNRILGLKKMVETENNTLGKELSNKEFQDILKKYPDDSIICIEYCNPRDVVYDKNNNLLRID